MISTVQTKTSTKNHLNKSLIDAADWLVTLNSGETTAQEQSDFKRWFAQADNAQAYKELQQTWQQFELAQPKAAQQTLNYALANKPEINTSFSKTRLFSVSAIAGLALLLASQSQTGRFIGADHYSLTEHSQSITLSDNSKIQLPPRSAVNIHYSQNARHIELVKGQVFIEVARDANRPLTITSQHGSTTALGTAFSVEQKAAFTLVQVTESTVKVCAKSATSSCKTLSAGQRVQVNTQQVGPVQDTAKNMQLDWHQQTLTVDNQPLVAVLALLQQHYPGYLKYNAHALQGLNISGVFSLKNTHESLQLIGTILPVKVANYGSMVLVVNKGK